MAKSKKANRGNYIIQRTDSIGTGDAETDHWFLKEAFVDTGVLGILRDTNDAKRIILGRTGSGKTALLQRLAECEENVVTIEPEALSLRHISNSTIIKFFQSLDVHLDIFYQFLWLHVISVELLKYKFGIGSESDKANFFSRLTQQIRPNPAKQKAIKYVEEWGPRFWQETETRVRELTDRMEVQLRNAIGANFAAARFEADGTCHLTEEQRLDITQRAKSVIDSVQVNELTNLISLLSEDIFRDPQQKYYIIIDGLDEDWADDVVRYRLIKALIDAIRKFFSVRNVKIIISLRTDLLAKVISATKTTGTQEEKYESMLMDVKWSHRQLEEMLDRRVSILFRRKYTAAAVHLGDILPNNQMEQKSPTEYIISRTFLRPRDVISFFNDCLIEADGKTKITVQDIRGAEKVYSAKRLRYICDEWRSVFPNLQDYIKILEKSFFRFTVDDIDYVKIDDFVQASLQEENRCHGPMYPQARRFLDGKVNRTDLALQLLWYLYRTGVVGVKNDNYSGMRWSFLENWALTFPQITVECRFEVHPGFWSALGVRL